MIKAGASGLDALRVFRGRCTESSLLSGLESSSVWIAVSRVGDVEDAALWPLTRRFVVPFVAGVAVGMVCGRKSIASCACVCVSAIAHLSGSQFRGCVCGGTISLIKSWGV